MRFLYEPNKLIRVGGLGLGLLLLLTVTVAVAASSVVSMASLMALAREKSEHPRGRNWFASQ